MTEPRTGRPTFAEWCAEEGVDPRIADRGKKLFVSAISDWVEGFCHAGEDGPRYRRPQDIALIIAVAYADAYDQGEIGRDDMINDTNRVVEKLPTEERQKIFGRVWDESLRTEPRSDPACRTARSIYAICWLLVRAISHATGAPIIGGGNRAGATTAFKIAADALEDRGVFLPADQVRRRYYDWRKQVDQWAAQFAIEGR
jgi:hypothetical protein